MRNIEISLKELLVNLVYRWLLVLVCIILTTLFFWGYKALRENSAESNQALIEAEAVLNRDLTVISELKSSANMEIDRLLNASKNSSKSLLTLRINCNPQSVDVYAVAEQYLKVFENAPLEALMKGVTATNLDANALKSSIKINEQFSGASNLKDPGLMTIGAISFDGSNAAKMARAVFDYLVANREKVAAIAGENTIELVSVKEATAAELAADLAKELDTQKSLLVQLSEDEDKAKEAYRRVAGSKLNNILFFGPFVGLVLGVIAATVGYLMQVTIVLPEQISHQFGIRYLGGYRRRKGRFIGRIGDLLAGDFLLKPTAQALFELSAANIDDASEPGTSILFTGSLDMDQIKEYAAGFSSHSVLSWAEQHISEDVNTSADAVRKLSDTEAVVLVERIRVSSIRNVGREIERINSSGKKLIGYVLY